MSQRKRYNSGVLNSHIKKNNNNNNNGRHPISFFHQPQIVAVALLILFSLSIINGTFGAENSTVDDKQPQQQQQQQPRHYKYSMQLMENGNVKNGFRPIPKSSIESSYFNNNNNSINNNNNNNNSINNNNNSIHFNNITNDSENIDIKINNNKNSQKYHQTTTNEINNLDVEKKNTIKDNFSFFKNGAFEIFQNYDNDDDDGDDDDEEPEINNSKLNNLSKQKNNKSELNKSKLKQTPPPSKNKHFTPNVKEFQNLVLKYVDDTLNRKSYEIISGFNIELYNSSKIMTNDEQKDEESTTASKRELPFFNQRSFYEDGHPLTFQDKLLKRLKDFAETHVVNVNIPRAVESTGRLFFFKGLKKIMWPILIGVQIAKTILLALFLPSIIGSLGKIVGKGISSVSGYNHGQDTVQDFEFKDNAINSDQDKYNDYAYPQAESTNNNLFAAQMYDAATATANNALSRFGSMDTIGQQKMTYVNNQPSMSSSSTMHMKKDDFNTFHDIPASSMLLTNYDPFYSPLLSRLDAVYQQLGLGSVDNELCREKLICLMYANPAKYAPYSNLVSAQLSRELNELRKPTSDNPDILRFFKYMRAAKDGQDGISCEQNYRDCMTLSESDSPAMINTYNDINKLVQARKIT